MKKQITFGLIASALALSTAAFAPTEAQANERERALNQMAMQMYMNNMAQQQLYNPYYGNAYYGNPYYGRSIYGNGYYTNGNRYWNNDWRYHHYNNTANTVGRILNRIF